MFRDDVQEHHNGLHFLRVHSRIRARSNIVRKECSSFQSCGLETLGADVAFIHREKKKKEKKRRKKARKKRPLGTAQKLPKCHRRKRVLKPFFDPKGNKNQLVFCIRQGNSHFAFQYAIFGCIIIIIIII